MRREQLNMNKAQSKGGGEHGENGSREDEKGVRGQTSGDGQKALSNEDESRIIDNVNYGQAELVEGQDVQHSQQEQAQGLQVLPGQVVCWERFLPLRSLKVLLVENDDSTRHVVSALLRNCSYEVKAVANGFEAWRILENLTNHIDLVLTEVDMPSLSGIGLLYKIMNHKTRSNIPVIMMSSNDSMGIVFTCLSKGATDFLVKPIRKNELKNLWQHVWRKCHSSSGSGSESGIRTQKSTKSKSVEGAKNDTNSNDEDGNGSIGLNAGDGSDNGSGTQSSWSKRTSEFDSLQPISQWDELADPPDSTCAQVIHLRPEVLHKNQVRATVSRKRQKLDNEHDLRNGASRPSDMQLRGQSQSEMETTTDTEEKHFNLESEGDEKKLEKGKVDLNYEAPTNELGENDAGLVGATTDTSIPQVDSKGSEVRNHHSSNASNIAAYDTKEGPSLELSLKQLGDISDIGTSTQEYSILGQSGPSAFFRYCKSKTANQAPTGNAGSCSPVDNSSEAAKHKLLSSSGGTPNARSNGSSNNNDMGSTTDNVSTKPEALGDRSMAKSTVNFHHRSAFHPVQDSISSQQPVSASEAGAMNKEIQVQHHHHHYHHHHHHVLNTEEQQQLNRGGLSSMNIFTKASHYTPSDIFAATFEGNAANYASASGSNNGSGQNGSHGQNTSSTPLVGEGTDTTNDNGKAGKYGTGVAIGTGSRYALDQNRLARREAALNKFQQKRKERCFEKKVRYQSRKTLAEQRPRVRGQFVRQAADDCIRKDRSKDAGS